MFTFPTQARTSQLGYIHILDDAQLTDDELSALDLEYSLFKNTSNLEVYYLEVESDYDLKSQAYTYVKDVNANNLILALSPNYYQFFRTGSAVDQFDNDDLNEIIVAMKDKETKYLQLSAFWTKVNDKLVADKQTIPDNRLLPRIVDNANLLTSSEVKDLETRLDDISERLQVEVAIVTTNGTNGKSIQTFAEDFYVYNGYGMTSEKSGILLAIDMQNRDWAFATHGYGITVFTDRGMEYMEKQFIESLSDGKYFEGFNKFADLCEQFIKQAKEDTPYDVGNMPKSPFNFFWIVVALVLAAIVSGSIVAGHYSQLKSVKLAGGAMMYASKGGLNLTDKSDIFVTSHVSRVPRPKESSSSRGSGGSSTHRHSSGRSFGGRSGKF
mgnify:FL=1